MPHPNRPLRRSIDRHVAALAAVVLLAVSACGGASGAPGASSDPSASPSAAVSPSPSPSAAITADPDDELCTRVAEVEFRLATLQAVELRPTNRTALDVELDRLLTGFDELDSVDLGDRRDELEGPLTRLGYRIGELELAVEDFRTNARPRRAAPHVEEDARKVADELAAFVILSRC